MIVYYVGVLGSINDRYHLCCPVHITYNDSFFYIIYFYFYEATI